ncbi:MAG: acyl-CoA dehydrogenase [bacterium]
MDLASERFIIEVKKAAKRLKLGAELSGLLPLLPMLYVAWADGILTPSEVETIRKKLEQQSWLTAAEKKRLATWLDPAAPPTTTQLLTWLSLIRAAAEYIPDACRQSLAELGIEIARIGRDAGFERCTSPEACAALAEIEEALGIIGPEAARELVATPAEKRAPSPEPGPAIFEVAAMTRLLDGETAAVREKVRTLLSDPIFEYEYDLDKDAHRELVLCWLRELAKQGLGALSYPVALGGKGSLSEFMAAFETIAFHDLSLAIKFGVQYGLFGGSILNLGTKNHHETYLPDVGSLQLPGCFAMTELGHGSNVRDIETVARYDPKTQEFVIHTPSESARKDYIGNAAKHGRMATVFAQLEIDGEPYGVHAFLTPIRDENGQPLPGVRIGDCGEKLGLNGIDNGRLWFDHVRIPRENLLDRFADVSPEGEYSSPIASASQRFFTMLGTLVGGRVSISAAGLSAAKSALTIAVRYAAKRRQFGPPGEAETILLDYPVHRRRLLPLLANAYALDFAQKHLSERYVQRAEKEQREVEVLAAGLKAFSTWNATETIQTCREACGGQGYLAENRFAALKADSDVFTTFEGDNTVLLQLVAKGLLTDLKHQFSDMKFFGMVKYLAAQASTAISELNPVVTRLTDETHLRDAEFQLGAFEYREKRLLVSAARRIKRRIDEGLDSYQAFIACQDHVVKLALAHVERIVLQRFLQGIETVTDPALAEVLNRLRNLFALARIEKDKGWFLESGYLEGNKSKAIRQQVDTLCEALRHDAVHLVNAFGIPDELLAAPIAQG